MIPSILALLGYAAQPAATPVVTAVGIWRPVIRVRRR